jgi:aryl-alcohol dehydrogenase-like predicted oxidoreductase
MTVRYLNLSGTDLNLSTICLGTGNFGNGLDRAASFSLLDAFVAAAGNFIDTAKVYADWLPGERSSSEKTIGRWLEVRKNRSNVIIATKGGHPQLNSMSVPRLAPAELTSDLNASLRNLKTDVIDLYWLHRDDPTRPVGEIIDTLQSFINSGKIRFYGCSNWQLARIEAAQVYATERGFPGFLANQMLWNLGLPDMNAMADKTIIRMDEDLWLYHNRNNWPALPFSSQANGFFARLAAGSLDRMNPNLRAVYRLPENRARFERLQSLKQSTGLGVTQIVLGYLASQPFPVIPIVGCQTLEQLTDTLSAADIRIDSSQMRYLLGEAMI